jgi:hypothetical protein
MKYMVRRYYSGYCNYEVEAENKDRAYEIAKTMSINYAEILGTLEDWEECNEVEHL